MTNDGEVKLTPRGLKVLSARRIIIFGTSGGLVTKPVSTVGKQELVTPVTMVIHCARNEKN